MISLPLLSEHINKMAGTSISHTFTQIYMHEMSCSCLFNCCEYCIYSTVFPITLSVKTFPVKMFSSYWVTNRRMCVLSNIKTSSAFCLCRDPFITTVYLCSPYYSSVDRSSGASFFCGQFLLVLMLPAMLALGHNQKRFASPLTHLPFITGVLP